MVVAWMENAWKVWSLKSGGGKEDRAAIVTKGCSGGEKEDPKCEGKSPFGEVCEAGSECGGGRKLKKEEKMKSR